MVEIFRLPSVIGRAKGIEGHTGGRDISIHIRRGYGDSVGRIWQ